MKRNRRNKKTLVTALSALLIVGLTVMVTLAYLQDSKTLTNTFTVGKIQIELKESKTDKYGNKIVGEQNIADEATTGIDYTLVAGKKYLKDPKITLKESEPVYIFVKVENGLKDLEKVTLESDTTIAAQMATNGWRQLKTPLVAGGSGGVEIDNVFYYEGTTDGVKNPQTTTKVDKSQGLEIYSVDARENTQTINVFENFILKQDIKDENVNSGNIIVTAYAIQSMGFNTPAAAWEASGF